MLYTGRQEGEGEYLLVCFRTPVFLLFPSEGIEESPVTFEPVFVFSCLVGGYPRDEIFEMGILFRGAGKFFGFPGSAAAMGGAGVDTGVEENEFITFRQHRLDDVRVTSLDQPTRVCRDEAFHVGNAVGQGAPFGAARKGDFIEGEPRNQVLSHELFGQGTFSCACVPKEDDFHVLQKHIDQPVNSRKKYTYFVLERVLILKA